jgi:hypothetical protein
VQRTACNAQRCNARHATHDVQRTALQRTTCNAQRCNARRATHGVQRTACNAQRCNMRQVTLHLVRRRLQPHQAACDLRLATRGTQHREHATHGRRRRGRASVEPRVRFRRA